MTELKKTMQLVILSLSLVSLACATTSQRSPVDPRALLTAGRYSEARAAALARGDKAPETKAIIALCLIAQSATPESGRKAVTVLTNGSSGIAAAAAAADMLDLMFEIPTPVDQERAMLAAEVALGAAGQGALKPETAREIQVGAASRSLVANVLERVHLGLNAPGTEVDTVRLLKIWNACYTLSGGPVEAADEREAWKLFASIGGLAMILSQSAPDDDLTGVMLVAAVSVLERNTNIAIAARCDFSSPFDSLRSALAHKRELLTRLESAVADATGCTRGTYAPILR